MEYTLTTFPSKVLLVVPALDDDPYSFSTPNLGMGYVGASLLSAGHHVTFFDMGLYRNDFTRLSELVRDLAPHVVGVGGFTPHYRNMLKIAAFVKKCDPRIITVLGGTHASALSEVILERENNIDFIIRGEGERAFPSLLAALYEKSDLALVPGLAYRDNGHLSGNPPDVIERLDDLEYPWKVINPLNYQQGRVHGYICRQLPLAQVLSSRGCPYHCTFCAGKIVHGRKIRMRQPSEFIREIEYLKNNYGIREIQIADDNFTFYQEHAMEVCQQVIDKKLDITWSLPNGVRADRLDESLLRTMKRAGCYYMAFGIESGSPRMLRIYKKSLDLEQARNSIALASRLGFITQGFFLIGHPEETEEDIEMTRRFISSVPFDKVLLILPFPYPGTELFEYYLKKTYGSVREIDWNTFKPADFSRIFEHLDPGYVQDQRMRIFKKFYLSPRNALRFLSKFRTWVQVKSAFYGLQVYLNVLQRRQ